MIHSKTWLQFQIIPLLFDCVDKGGRVNHIVITWLQECGDVSIVGKVVILVPYVCVSWTIEDNMVLIFHNLAYCTHTVFSFCDRVRIPAGFDVQPMI